MKKTYMTPDTEKVQVNVSNILGAFSEPLLLQGNEATTTGTGDDKEYETLSRRNDVWEDE